MNASRLGDWCIDMAYTSFQDFCEAARLVTPGGFSAVRGRWKAAMAGGGTETLTEFLLRENEQSEDVYLDRVAEAFDWQRIDLSDVRPTNESLRRIPSKVANQHVVMPVKVEEGVLEVAVSSPFETGLLGAVRFAAQLDFEIEPATWAAVQTHAAAITEVSVERVSALPVDTKTGKYRLVVLSPPGGPA